MNHRIGMAALAGFLACIVAANWALGRWGVIPIGFGLEAPTGVVFAGLTFGLRDIAHRHLGRSSVIIAIVGGAVLSYIIEDAVTIPGGLAPIAVASGLAFLFSETADLLVYERIGNWVAAVAASNTVGAVVDSCLFLWLAFGGLDHLAGNLAGKLLMIAPALLLMWPTANRRELAAA